MSPWVRNLGGSAGALPRRCANEGYTRTDLLVGLAAVSVLVSLAGGLGLRTARNSRLKVCEANLGRVGQAVLAFAGDHDQTLPGPVPDQGGELWWWYKEQVKGYAGLRGPAAPGDAVFACPEDRGYSEPRPFHQTARFAYGSYVFNGVTLPGMPNIAGWRTGAVREPTRTLLVMEWTAHAPLSWHRSRTGRRNLPFYDRAESVVGFVDGHVSFLPMHYDGHTPAFSRDPIPGYAYRYSGVDPTSELPEPP